MAHANLRISDLNTMAKGGGKAKGRPRKLVETLPAAPVGSSPIEIGETLGVRDKEFHETILWCRKSLSWNLARQLLNNRRTCWFQGRRKLKVRKIEDKDAPITRKGMDLGYVAPMIKDGKPTAKLCVSELEKESAKWKNAIILYVIGEEPTIAYLKNYLQTQCGILGEFEIYYHNEGYFLVRFELSSDKDRMVYEGPYMLSSRPIIVKSWVADFSLEKEVLREVPLWVRLPKLPLNFWSGDSLSRIGSVIGKPVCADECTTLPKRISYARLLIEVDITKPILYKIQIEGEEGKMIEQQVFYEWVPMFCQQCHKVGHICRK